MLKQHKDYGHMEFASVYFTSTTGWVIESVDNEYVNLSIFSQSPGSIYTELSRRLKKRNEGSD